MRNGRADTKVTPETVTDTVMLIQSKPLVLFQAFGRLDFCLKILVYFKWSFKWALIFKFENVVLNLQVSTGKGGLHFLWPFAKFIAFQFCDSFCCYFSCIRFEWDSRFLKCCWKCPSDFPWRQIQFKSIIWLEKLVCVLPPSNRTSHPTLPSSQFLLIHSLKWYSLL